ncbi:MAG TPA: hypothetical protein VFI22_02220, partial [Thermomicrobiales bacterium]|nr:hypothetical protein [Thermomicrobiales bacterium]
MNERDQPHVHDHDHDHDHEHNHEKDPAEQEALARDLAGELTDLFVQFVAGEIDFAEVSFATYDVLQDLHIIATGAYELVEADEASGDSDDSDSDDSDSDDGGLATGYSKETATEEQEDLAQEPS